MRPLLLPLLVASLWSPAAVHAQRPAPSVAVSAPPPTSSSLAPPRASITMDQVVDLAAVRTIDHPFATFVDAFNAGDTVRAAIDTSRFRAFGARTVDVYVVAHRTPDEWRADPRLVDVAGGPRTVTLSSGSIRDNTFVLDDGTLLGNSGTTEVGIGYDVVLDGDRDGGLSRADLIDGWGDVPGFRVLPNLTFDGPYTAATAMYNGGRFRKQRVYYPAEIATLGELPVVVISHGNGHDYQWYDHLGNFLASWGYVVTSHENNTGPGIETAAESTLRNTNIFLGQHGTLAGGVLQGHVDKDTIVWIGHSRGGEGVARAYNRLVAGDPLAQRYDASDVKLVSSIAPTDFQGPGKSDPLDVTYHLWTGGADADVTGCADSDVAQTFHLYERARGERMSTSLHGVGHGDFHDGGGSSVANGPCQVGRDRTHRLMKGYLLPLLAWVLDGNAACRELLWRQWESFRPLGSPGSACVVVDLMYQPGPATPRRVLDDFETNHGLDRSSSGGRVVGTVAERVEGRLDDSNTTFNPNPGDAFNGMTLAGAGDPARGTVFEWDAGDERYLAFEVPPDLRDVSDYRYLSFRACQATRDAHTTAELGDVDFTVVLTDLFGRSSAVRIGTYGGGIEEPYQRRLCGGGKGWANEWETIRIPLDDFRANGRRLELRALTGVTFRFGHLSGSAFGRIGLDELEFTAE